MRKSVVNSDCKFNKERWVVSILNTGSQFSGHAIILIEGLKNDGSLFVGQYDITASVFEDNTDTFNPKGYINDIRTFDKSDRYERDYSKYAGSAYDDISPINAQKIIDAVKEDIPQVKAYMDYKRKCDSGKPPKTVVKPLLFQLLGTESTLSKKDAGVNCAVWCATKLRRGGIDIGDAKKPSTVANRFLETANRYRYHLLGGGVLIVAALIAAKSDSDVVKSMQDLIKTSP